jgi:hypothetical protein
MKNKSPMATHLARLLLQDPTTAALRKLERLIDEGALSPEDTDTAWSLVHECRALSQRAEKWATRLQAALARASQRP